jgi:basic amino acid/polyamine antiporter, APA family
LMALSGASFAELACRFPVAAGEAAYAREAFRSDRLATIVGLLVAVIAMVSSAAISIGSAGYPSVFVPLPNWMLVSAVVLSMGVVAVWGVKESVSFAGLMTLIEIGGLLVLVLAGILSDAPIGARLPEMMVPQGGTVALTGLVSATLLAVFAFIGFEGLANVAEEVRDPKRNLPRAIFLTLGIATVLYIAVVYIALVAVGDGELAQSEAPLALVFEKLTGASPGTMALIALVATLNGIIVQIIMSSRVLYGLAQQGNLPAVLGEVSRWTRTPVAATAATTAVVLVLGLMAPLNELAEATSRLTLFVFALVNASLIRIKNKAGQMPPDIYQVPSW